MNEFSFRRLLLLALMVQTLSMAPSYGGGGHSRWGDLGVEVQGGSFGLNFQKRLFQPGLEEEMCVRCRQYLEFGFEWDEFDAADAIDDEDVDATAFTIGYRYYVLTGDGPEREKEGLAAYLAVGIGRYDLDPGDTEPGYYAKAALEYPLTQSTREDGTLKKVFWSVVGSVRYDEIELAESDLDDVGARIGIRMVVPSRRDRRRNDCQRARQALLDKGVELEMILKEERPSECIEPDDEQPERSGAGGEGQSGGA